MKSRTVFIAILSLLFLSGCSFSLAADITPPPGSENLPFSATQPAELSGPLFPLVPPNLQNGGAIYEEKCAPCHGATGQGDGPRALDLPNPVPALGSVELARQASPARWFSVVLRGNLERFMPPFPSLSDSERWDVVAYALSLSASQESITLGNQLFQDQCARCHGEKGKGDGPDAASLSQAPTNLVDLAFSAEKSAVDLYRGIAVGNPPAMPSFSNQLSEDEIWALTEYVRSMTFVSPPAEEAVAVTPSPVQTTPQAAGSPTPAPTNASQGMGVISGQITNGSGGSLPPGLTVMLHGFDSMEAVITQTTTVRADGTYHFSNVEMVEGRAYIASVEYGQLTYGSDVSVVPPKANTLNLPITVYDTTTDSTVITVDRLHLFFDLLDADTVRVVELYIMSNTSNKTLIATGPGEPMLRFKLPVGSTNLEFDDSVLGERYVETPDGFGDTVAVQPGSGNYQVLFSFEMPYNRKLELAQPVLQRVDAVVILVPEGSVRIRSDMVKDDGLRDVEGARYHLYSGGSLEPGDELRLTVSGGAGGELSLGGSSNSLLVGLGALGVALVIAGVWFYRQSRLKAAQEESDVLLAAKSPTQENIETVMDAIIALDDLYKAGQLPEVAYHQRRAELKTRLQELKDATENRE